MMGAAALALAACAQEAPEADEHAAPAETEMSEGEAAGASQSASEKLAAVLEAQSDDTKARYQYRHPKETLEFLGVKPGMTVVDALPGEPGWWAPILVDYLGADGKLIGADYSMEMWPLFEGFATAEFLEKRQSWTDSYQAAASALGGEDSASVGAFVFGSAPAELAGTVDVVFMNRAAHHFNRLEGGRFFTEALADIDMVLKPGGIVGVVQHRAPEDAPDDWANGDNGYVKQSQIIAVFENAGFELLDMSEVNANPKDQPTTDDFVWRLPPTLATSRDHEADEAQAELREQMLAIGETDRMTLKFRKPE